MPLPENGAAWPPPAMATPYAEMRTDDAWYSGDAQRLARIYAGGTRGDGRRRLWGRPRPAPGGRDTRMHIPLPGDIATTAADLLWAEAPTITVPTPATQDRLDVLVAEGGVVSTLLEGAEVGAALGGHYLRVTWDTDLARRPLLTTVHADAAVPEFRWGLLTGVTFWRELAGSSSATVLRHLERHEPGRILHGLYEGTAESLGRRVPLTEHPETAALADSLGPDGDAIATGIRELTAGYVPNMRPNRKHRGSQLGRSDYAAPLYDLFDSLDETWTSWLRDIRLARARLIVPDSYLRDLGPGRGAAFDGDREVWQGLHIPPGDGEGITLSQFSIRVEEHERTAAAITRTAVQMAGYSPQSFGEGDAVAATATEVVARERRSMVTRLKKLGYAVPEISRMLYVMLLLDRQLYTPGLIPERPTVTPADSVSEDPETTARTVSLLQQAQAVSADTRVRMLHPDWDDAAVAEEVDRILTETGATVPDPMQAGDRD